MNYKKMPHRQIHIDFHTSEHIPEVGLDFDEDEFGKTLKDAHVEHVNLFAKCHHGWFYYPSEVGAMHPKLKTDLLDRQVAACRKYGISFSIYTCVGWNEDCANRHPEWLEMSPEGVLGYKKPHERGYYQWQTLCLNSMEYRELIKKELCEEYARFHPLGFWIDIIQPHECVCESCRKKATKLGLDIGSAADRQKLARLAQLDYMRDIYDYLHSLDSELHVYFNGFAYAFDLGDEPELSNANKRDCVTFMDIESLPSTEWGYSHFPLAVNYVNKYDTHDVIMMNGKFHLAWGDFGSLRNEAALEYECFRAAANGAGCCIGDQLHPRGRLDKAVYQRIGKVFAQLEETEKWCADTEKEVQIGVFGTARSQDLNSNGVDRSLEGAYRILSEGKYQYDIVDLNDSYDKYELLILPDSVFVNDEAARRIDGFVKAGGKLLVSGFSAASEDGFVLESLPVIYEGRGLSCPRYMDITEDAFHGVPEMKTVSYSGGARVSAKQGAITLCETVDSYFDRSEEHFCSHRQTPPKAESDGEPCIVTDGNVTYVSNMLFRDIAVYGLKAYKDILLDLISRLLPDPIVKTDLPAFAEVYVRRQGENKIVHILNYIVQRKCVELDTVEESVPIYDRRLSIYSETAPKLVRLVPSNEPVAFEYEDGYVNMKLPRLDARTLIEIVC